jgi:hypothetical protein
MNEQQLFNILISICGFLAGWVLNNIYKSLKVLEDDMKDFPHYYVTKEDYRNDINEIKQMLNKIFDRLENKVDK